MVPKRIRHCQRGPSRCWRLGRQYIRKWNTSKVDLGFGVELDLAYNLQEGRDGYDTVEWIAKQSWCNGAVGLVGNSWLAISQWCVNFVDFIRRLSSRLRVEAQLITMLG